MSLSLLFRNSVLCCLASAYAFLASAQEGFPRRGSEYSPAGPLQGLQAHPDVSINSAGGFLVWEDNIVDGKGLGIRAQALNADLTKTGPAFRVNQVAPGDQEHPRVALLKNGGAVFVWQGGRQGFQHIYARFLSASNSWFAGDIQVSSFVKNFQALPAVTVLENGNVVVVWGSFDQFAPKSLQDVYGQVLSPSGEKIGGEFLVNQWTAYNQRSPAIAAFKDGGFVVTWVSELQRSGPVDESDPAFSYPIMRLPSVDIYARKFDQNATAAGPEFKVNTGNDACANPSIAATANGEFLIAWSQMDSGSPRYNRWDVWSCTYSSLGIPGSTRCVNAEVHGDQFAPQASASGTNFIILWTSMGQDGDWEGVFGRLAAASGSPIGGEFPVNSTTAKRQFHPAIAVDDARFLAVWSGNSSTTDLDIFAQQFVAPSYVATPVTASYAAPYTDPYLNNSTPVEPPKLDPPVVVGGGGSNAVVLGSFHGIFYDTNGINVATAGGISAIVADRGSFSAKISLAGKTISASGRFDSAGDATARISRGNLRALTLQLHRDGDQLRGSLTDGSWISDVLANRDGFSKSKPAPEAGTLMLDVPGAAVSAASPGGDSYWPVKIDALGNVQWAASLADGTKITQKSALSSQGLWPVYVPLYGGRGLILGWAQVTNSTLSGQLVWIKPAGVAGKYYPGGFTNEINVAGVANGAMKSASASSKISSSTRNLVLIGGGLTAPIVTPISIDAKNRVTTSGPNKISLSITASTGLFRGSVVNPATGKPIQFQGALFDEWDVGLGYFLNPAQSGQALIAPAP